MAAHFSILAWKIPQTEAPGGLQPMGSQRVQHDSVTITLPGVDFGTPLTATFPRDVSISSAWFPLWAPLLPFLTHLCSSGVCLGFPVVFLRTFFYDQSHPLKKLIYNSQIIEFIH